MENKTAVEWLIEQISKVHFKTVCSDLVQHALELEKQQIMEAFSEGETNAIKTYYESGKNYYSETYKKT